jgi:hypothetical protein
VQAASFPLSSLHLKVAPATDEEKPNLTLTFFFLVLIVFFGWGAEFRLGAYGRVCHDRVAAGGRESQKTILWMRSSLRWMIWDEESRPSHERRRRRCEP